MCEWQPIETFPEDYPHWTSEYDIKNPKTKYYNPCLVAGPTWEGPSGYYPSDGDNNWTGDVRIAIAHTWGGNGYWIVESDAPSDYDTYIKPTHWMPLPSAPSAKV